jgi:hypothetical protein
MASFSVRDESRKLLEELQKLTSEHEAELRAADDAPHPPGKRRGAGGPGGHGSGR